jgi:hypothetical protein
MDEEEYLEFLDSRYRRGGNQLLSGNLPGTTTTESMNERNDDGTEDEQHGQSFVAGDRTPRKSRYRRKGTARLQDSPVESYWNVTTNQPVYQPFRWGNYLYSLPKVPPDTARDEQNHIMLTLTIDPLLKEGAPGRFVEKYNILWNRFMI